MTMQLLGVDLGGTQIREQPSPVRTASCKSGWRRLRWRTKGRMRCSNASAIRSSKPRKAGRSPPSAWAPGPAGHMKASCWLHPIYLAQLYFPCANCSHYALGFRFYRQRANLAGLAEYRYGAGRKSSHMIYITVSTGIGGGIISGKRLLIGRFRAWQRDSATLQLTIQADKKGATRSVRLKVFASGPNFARRARRELLLGAQSMVLEVGKRRHRSGDAPIVAEGGRQRRQLCPGRNSPSMAAISV